MRRPAAGGRSCGGAPAAVWAAPLAPITLAAHRARVATCDAMSACRRRARHQNAEPRDYVSKPFSLRELAARVRAVMRRQRTPAVATTVYRGKHLVADFDAVAISVDSQPVRLTRREFELLRFLVENKNRVISRDRLLERVWGYDRFIETRSVDVHVGRLRSKLGPARSQIETVVGLGYRFIDSQGDRSPPAAPAALLQLEHLRAKRR